MEFRRILGRWSFWMLVLLALALNVFLFLRAQGQQYSEWAGAYEISEKELQQAYVEQIRELQAMPIADAVELYQRELQQIQDQGLSYQYQLEDDVRQNMVLPLLLYQSGYPDYLKKVQEDAQTLGTISIFADKDAFSSDNLQMTARDFGKLDGKLTMGSFRGISCSRRTDLWEHRGGGLVLLRSAGSACGSTVDAGAWKAAPCNLDRAVFAAVSDREDRGDAGLWLADLADSVCDGQCECGDGGCRSCAGSGVYAFSRDSGAESAEPV